MLLIEKFQICKFYRLKHLFYKKVKKHFQIKHENLYYFSQKILAEFHYKIPLVGTKNKSYVEMYLKGQPNF